MQMTDMDVVLMTFDIFVNRNFERNFMHTNIVYYVGQLVSTYNSFRPYVL